MYTFYEAFNNSDEQKNAKYREIQPHQMAEECEYTDETIQEKFASVAKHTFNICMTTKELQHVHAFLHHLYGDIEEMNQFCYDQGIRARRIGS